MIDHFERLARSQDIRLKAKKIAALAALVTCAIVVFALTVVGAMVLE
jgi:hypothetical protein